MKHKDITGIIPGQFTGKEIEADATIELTSSREAKAFYETVKNRLLNVNNWHKIAGIVSAKFQVVNEQGEEVSRNVRKGDHFKIDIPGPGSKEGSGYDWVCVEEIKEISANDTQAIGIRVRPGKNPFGEKDETAHFYSDEATSSFIIMGGPLKVTAWIVDHNIKPNDYSGSLADKVRNIAVGIGAIGLFSKIQWQGLAKGLVEKE